MRTWDHFKWWLLFGLIVWLLLVAVFLIDHSRGYSGAMIAERIWRTVSEIVLLKWVTKYQTLIAGIGAVLGGAFVLFAAKIQLAHQREHLDQQQIREMASTLFLVSNFFYRACTEYKTKRGDSLALAIRAETLAPVVTQCNPNLTNILFSAIEELRTKLEQKSTQRVPTAIFLYGASSIFAESAKLIQSRKSGAALLTSEMKLPPKAVLKYIEDVEGKEEHLSWLKTYFDLPDDPDNGAPS